MKLHLTSFLLAAWVAAAGLPLKAQDYHSNDLTPPGSISGKLSGLSSGSQVGSAGRSGVQPRLQLAGAPPAGAGAEKGFQPHAIAVKLKAADGRVQVVFLGEGWQRARRSPPPPPPPSPPQHTLVPS